jgi:hypothetical protein
MNLTLRLSDLNRYSTIRPFADAQLDRMLTITSESTLSGNGKKYCKTLLVKWSVIPSKELAVNTRAEAG